jgi:hypothetical protein
MSEEITQQEELNQETPEEQSLEGQEQPQEEHSPAEQSKAKPTPQESWKQLRERAERAERAERELERRLQEVEQRQKELAKPKEPDYEYGDDDLIEGKHLKKEREAIKKELTSYQQRLEEMTTETRLKTNYPDFETVVSQDGIEKLRKLYPSIAASINSNPNLYEKAEAAYAAIKQLGLYENKEFEKDKQKAQANMAKPRALGSISPQQGETPLQKANMFADGLTPDLERKLRKEVEEAIRKR